MIVVPSPADSEKMADWAELSCLIDNRETLSWAEMLRALEDAEVGDPEAILAGIWQEIERRSRFLPSKYPLEVHVSRLLDKNPMNAPLEYLFPLLLSCHNWYKSTKIKKADQNTVSKLFEGYSTLAIRRYLNGKALNVGWPRIEGLPKSFRKSIDHVCKLMNEGLGPCNLISRNAKDEGVDVIAWIPFPDNRPNKTILLAQCTTGMDLEDKAHEPSLGIWRNFINYQVSPIPAFAFPFICTDDNTWSRLSGINGSILFDRLRLSAFYEIDEDQDIKSRISDWVNKQVDNLPRLDA